MKRKFTFALSSIVAVGGALICFTHAQELPSIPQAPDKLTTTGQTRGSYLSSDMSGMAGTYTPSQVNTNQGNIATILNQLKSVEGAEKEGVIAKLKTAVGEQFDQRQDSKLNELVALEEQIKKLKEIHNKRTLQRDQIVGDRVQQLIREVDGLGWGTDIPDKSDFVPANANRSDSRTGNTSWPNLRPKVPATPAEPSSPTPRAATPPRR